jgi:protein O-mannosyl-transferase
MERRLLKRRSNIALCLFLCTVTAALYFRAAFFPFCILDDSEYVSQNAYVRGGLSLHSVQWAFTTFHAANWHPVTWLSLMADSRIFGTNPMGYHVVNVVFHLINTALIFLLFVSITGAAWRSAFVAALFAFHPLHVESVAWISERKDVLSTMFWIITLLFYSAYVRQGRRGMYLLALAAFVLGLMAKPMLVTTPLVLLLLDYWPFHRLTFSPFATVAPPDTVNAQPVDFKTLMLEKLPFLLLSIASSLVTVYAQSGSNAVSSLKIVSPLDRLENAVLSYAVYLRKMVLPFDLAVYYPLVPIGVWKASVAFFLLGWMLLIAYKKRDNYPYLVVGVLWYLVTLLPVIGVIQVGEQSMADRYTYFPLIGLFVIVGWGAADLAAGFPKCRYAVLGMAGAAILCCVYATSHQLTFWKDNIALFSRAVDVTHDNFKAHYCLGMAYSRGGRPDLAAGELREALRINPDEPYSLRNLARSLVSMGKMDEAIAEYGKYLEKYPDDPHGHNDLGVALLQQGHFDEAIQHFIDALRVKPTFGQAAGNLQFAKQQKARSIQDHQRISDGKN